MQVRPAQLPLPSRVPSANAPLVRLVVASIGHLVAPADFAGCVHSVFARACNFACGNSLLTLLTAGGDHGPTMLVLAHDAPPRDLRALFEIGDVITWRGDGVARTRRTELWLGDAVVWRPAPPRALASPARIDVRRRFAAARLAHSRRSRSSMIDRAGSTVVSTLAHACRALDREPAAQAIDRLVGWGEGLTPAGDDFLVGWMAALSRLASNDDDRQRFVDHVGAAIFDAASRTTPIAAQALRLAVHGHVVASLDELRNALLGGDDDDDRLERAVGRALAIGATSGADLVSGLLSGLSAWLPESVYAS